VILAGVQYVVPLGGGGCRLLGRNHRAARGE
jgi:hypothetical protein